MKSLDSNNLHILGPESPILALLGTLLSDSIRSFSEPPLTHQEPTHFLLILNIGGWQISLLNWCLYSVKVAHMRTNMISVLQHKRLDEATLVDQLNQMLQSINLPISLVSPTDLTPSLLIALLESVIDMRIPIIDRNKETKNSRQSKVQNMKIFLGVLETDVLNSEIDLSEIDPRRLADGEWEEVYYIGELLCWIGRKLGFVGKQSVPTSSMTSPGAGSSLHQSPLPKSQLDLDAESIFQGGTGSTKHSNATLSSFVPIIGESNTTVTTANGEEGWDEEDGYSDGVSDILGGLSPFKKPSTQCIHDVPSPIDSLLFAAELPPASPQVNNLSSPCLDATTDDTFVGKSGHPTNVPIRYSGFIKPVDENYELQSFELSRSLSSSKSYTTKQDELPVKIESVKAQYTRTLQLLNERARLLTQLADLKNSNG